MSLRHGHRFITCKQWFVRFCVAFLVLNKELIRNRSGDLKGFFHIWWQKMLHFPFKVVSDGRIRSKLGFWMGDFLYMWWFLTALFMYIWLFYSQIALVGRRRAFCSLPDWSCLHAKAFHRPCGPGGFPGPLLLWCFSDPWLCMQTRMPCFTGVFLGVPQGYLKHSITAECWLIFIRVRRNLGPLSLPNPRSFFIIHRKSHSIALTDAVKPYLFLMPSTFRPHLNDFPGTGSERPCHVGCASPHVRLTSGVTLNYAETLCVGRIL